MSTASSNLGFHWREGEHFCADLNLVVNAGSSASTVTFTMPTVDGVQLTINSSVLSGRGVTDNPSATMIGQAEWFDQGAAWKVITPTFFTATTIRFNQSPGQLVGTDLAANDGLKVLLKIPVTEWR
jgi:hypothetical protein